LIQGRFPFTDLIEYFPMEAISHAIGAALSGEVVKPVLPMS
jgi:aryl-alcohol dehydrogenase